MRASELVKKNTRIYIGMGLQKQQLYLLSTMQYPLMEYASERNHIYDGGKGGGSRRINESRERNNWVVEEIRAQMKTQAHISTSSLPFLFSSSFAHRNILLCKQYVSICGAVTHSRLSIVL